MNAIVRLTHPRSRDSQGQEMFLVASSDKQTRNYDKQTRNYDTVLKPTSLPINPKVKELRLSGMKWLATYIYDYLQKTSIKINVATDEGKQPK